MRSRWLLYEIELAAGALPNSPPLRTLMPSAEPALGGRLGHRFGGPNDCNLD